jgi:hypothetical protein
MTREDGLIRIINEIHANSIPATPEYTPSLDHYMPIRNIIYYLEMAYGIGFDEGRQQGSHRKPIMQIKNGKHIRTFTSVSEAAHMHHVNKSAIVKAAKKHTQTCAGFEWEYV